MGSDGWLAGEVNGLLCAGWGWAEQKKWRRRGFHGSFLWPSLGSRVPLSVSCLLVKWSMRWIPVHCYPSALRAAQNPHKRCDISGQNFLTFSSHKRTRVSSSAPPLATPFPTSKSLNPKVIYPMHVSNLWATCVCFKVCRMYFCNIISNLCN